jgi:hypothetical protein
VIGRENPFGSAFPFSVTSFITYLAINFELPERTLQ